MESEVENAFNGPDDEKILNKQGAPDIKRLDFKRLLPNAKLGDEIINCYLTMFANRSKNSSGLPKAFAMTTHFYR